MSFFSPEQLRNNTAEKINAAVRTVVSPVAEFHSLDSHTPERAEFGVPKPKTVLDEEKREIVRMPSGSESEEDDELTGGSSGDSSGGSPAKTDEEEDSLSDSEGLEEDELAELELTALKYDDENPSQGISEQQVSFGQNEKNNGCYNLDYYIFDQQAIEYYDYTLCFPIIISTPHIGIAIIRSYCSHKIIVL